MTYQEIIMGLLKKMDELALELDKQHYLEQARKIREISISFTKEYMIK